MRVGNSMCVCVCMHESVCMCNFFIPGEMCDCVYLFRVLMCACVFVFESSNVSEILQPCFIQWEVRGSSTNSSPNVLNGLFWSDGCRASCSLHRRRHSAPHSPARLSQQPTISLPSHHQPHCHYGNCAHARIQSVLEVRRGYSTESRVKCCPNDLGQEQNKCEREASCLCIWVESWKLGVERRGSRPRHSTGRVWWITIRSINMLPLWYKALRVKFKARWCCYFCFSCNLAPAALP